MQNTSYPDLSGEGKSINNKFVPGLVSAEWKTSGNPPLTLFCLMFSSEELRTQYFAKCEEKGIKAFSISKNIKSNCYSVPYNNASQEEKNKGLRLDSLAAKALFDITQREGTVLASAGNTATNPNTASPLTVSITNTTLSSPNLS